MTLTDREFVIRANAREQLFEVLGTDFFKGADVTTIDEIEIPPLTTLDIPISLNNGTLPHDELPIDAYRYLSVSTRSRYAQSSGLRRSGMGSSGTRLPTAADGSSSIVPPDWRSFGRILRRVGDWSGPHVCFWPSPTETSGSETSSPGPIV